MDLEFTFTFRLLPRINSTAPDVACVLPANPVALPGVALAVL